MLSCDLCEKSFTQFHILKRHHRIVHKILPKKVKAGVQIPKMFQCNMCNINFTLFSNLNRHKRKLHTDDDPFFCKNCKISFLTHDLLKRHNMTNYCTEILSCNECGMHFKLLRNLKIHTIKHFSCIRCKITFSTSNATKNHVAVEHKKDFSCDKSCFAFVSMSKLKYNLINCRQNFKGKLNGFLLFCKQNKTLLQFSVLPTELNVGKRLGKMWRELKLEERSRYTKEAIRLNQENLGGTKFGNARE